MAAITLKDLMDPLTKIAAATEKTSQKIDAVVAAVTGGTGAATLNKEVYKELQTQTNLLRAIVNSTKGSMINVNGKEIDQDKLKEGSEAIRMLGGGVTSLAAGLMSFMLVPVKVISKFTNTIKDLLESFNNIDENKIKSGAESFSLISTSIGDFSKSLALSSILLIPGIIGAKLLSATIKGIIPAFIMLGENSDNVKKGADVLDLMGISIKSFTKGLLLAAIGSSIALIFSPMIVASIILIGGAFALLGKLEKNISTGTDSINKIGKGLVWFSVGLVTFALATMFILTQPNILMAMAGSLLLIGGAFALLGLVDKSIRKGAAAMFAVSISLIAFSIGYLVFSLVTSDVSMKSIELQASVLLGIGITVGLLGIVFGPIIKGAFAIAGIGLGLAVFSLGYFPFATVMKDTTMDDIGIQLGLLLGLGLEFAAAGLGAPFILAGAAAYAAVGVSLLALAPGLLAIKAVDFTEVDSLKLTTMLTGIKSAFLGGSNADEGFFSKVGGAITGAIDSVRMIEAAVGFTAAGVALKTLSWGLTSFKKIGWNNQLSLELTTALNGITTAFALAGGGPQVPSTSIFGQLFGFKRTQVEEGINSVMGAGKALSSIAQGLMSFQNLINSGVNFGEPDGNNKFQQGTLGYAVTNTIGFVNQAFASIAEQGNVESGGFFGSLLGIKQNKVAEGIASVRGAGKELTDIVTVLKSFQEMVTNEVDFNKLGLSITNVVGFVQTAFATVAGEGNVESGGFFGSLLGIKQNKVAEGIASVKGAGKELTDIVTGLKSFQEMVTNEVDFNKLGTIIKNSITLIGDAFAIIGGKEQSDSVFFGLMKWDENLVKKGIQNIKGAGQELTNIAEGLMTFNEMKDPSTIANGIKTLFTSIGDTFTFYYNKPKFQGQLDHMKGFITEISENARKGYLDKAASGMKEIAKAINSIDSIKAEAFANLFKGAGDLTNNKDAFDSLLEAVKDIKEALSGGNIGNTVNQSGGASTSPVIPAKNDILAPILNDINISLSRLNGTMTSLPAQIQSIRIIIPE